MADKTLMILGLGGVGTYAAHLAARLPGIKIVVGDIREEHAIQVTNSLISDRYFQQDYNRFPDVTGFGIDMMDDNALEEALGQYQPDIIFNATTLLSWWHLHRLPHNLARRVYYGAPEGSGLRPWAPGHGVLLYNLMKAVKKLLPDAHVVNVSGPDYLHEILGKAGLAPTVGVGNVAMFEPILKTIIGKQRNVHPEAIDITMVGHHCMCMQIFQEGTLSPEIPYYLKIEEYKKDITADFDIDTDLWAQIPGHMPLLSEANQQCISASAMQVIKGLLYDTGYLLHAPGVEGLPGGCPVRIDASGAKAVTPPDMTREQMLKLMYAANRCEGFEVTQDGGTAEATPHCIETVEEVFGIEWKYKTFKPETMFEAFKEITGAFEILLKKHV